MEQYDLIERINELEREIAALPPGSIAVKKINGKDYYYHRITRNKKRTETYVDFDKVDELREQIEYHNTRYHLFDEPEIEDFEYDALFRELISILTTRPTQIYATRWIAESDISSLTTRRSFTQ